MRLDRLSFRPPEASSTEQGIDDWFTRGRVSLLLLAFFFAVFPDVFLGTKSFFLRDFGCFGYPLAHYHRECFWRGEIPLWNPLSMCGVPFLAQWNTLVCYPGSLFYLIFPLSWSLGVFCIGHLIFGGVGMYSLAKHWTGSSFGGAVAALLFAFNGLSLNSLMWPATSAGYGWMPWVVLLAERGLRDSRRAVLLAILAGAMQMLTGMPEVILLTWVIVAGIALGYVVVDKTQRLTIIARLIVMVMAVSGLCAVQLLPFFQLVQAGNRDAGYEFAGTWAAPGLGWGNFLIPLFGCFRGSLGVYFQNDQYWTSSYYVGIGTIFLAGVALWRCRSRRTLFLALITLTGLLFALGDNGYVYSLTRKVFPSISFIRFPVKFIVLAVFGFSLLAAYASAYFLRRPGVTIDRRLGLVIGGVLLAAMGVLVAFAWRLPMLMENPRITASNAGARALFLVATITVVFLMQRTPELHLRWRLALGLIVLLWVDVWTHVPSQNPRVERRALAPGLVRAELKLTNEPSLGESRAMIHPYAHRILSADSARTPMEDFMRNRLGLFSNCNLLEDWPSAMAFYPIVPAEIDDIIYTLYRPARVSRRPLLDFMNVVHITEPGQLTRWQTRPSAMPFATIGQQAEFAPDENIFLQIVLHPNFDPRDRVYFQKELEATIGRREKAAGRIIEKRVEREKLTLVVESDRPTFVTLSQTWYPNWKAYVNGQPAPLLRANYAFQSVPVPAGKSEVTVRYEDGRFRSGALISLLSLIGWGVAWRKSRSTSTENI